MSTSTKRELAECCVYCCFRWNSFSVLCFDCKGGGLGEEAVTSSKACDTKQSAQNNYNDASRNCRQLGRIRMCEHRSMFNTVL